ncbi:hypothetical protein [Pseudomonas lundensis]|nr:hypothetical protein [Pseudomonas lundensis]
MSVNVRKLLPDTPEGIVCAGCSLEVGAYPKVAAQLSAQIGLF